MFRAKLQTSNVPRVGSGGGAGGQGEDGEALAWAFEMQLYLDCAVEIGLDGDSLDKVFELNARAVYGLA